MMSFWDFDQRSKIFYRLFFVALLFLEPFAFGGAFFGQIDRLLASVNGKIVTEGDLKLGHSLNTLVGLEVSLGSNSKESELDRLVDLELIRQELENFPIGVSDQDSLEARMKELEARYTEKGGLDTILRELGLQRTELESYVRLQISILRFVQFRFRPFVNVSSDDIRLFYDQKLIPPLRNSGSEIPALEAVSAKIEEILQEEKINVSLDQWLQDLRRHSRIEFFTEGGPPPEEAPR